MSVVSLSDPRLYVILFRIDCEFAKETQGEGCPCGGALDVANYPRKPRGFVRSEAEASKRFSFCCRICRLRTTPASVRFLDRRVYYSAIVVMVTALSVGISRARLKSLRNNLGIDRRTVERWRRWWSEVFPRVRDRLSPPLEESGPHSFVKRATQGLDSFVDLLRSLARIGCAP